METNCIECPAQFTLFKGKYCISSNMTASNFTTAILTTLSNNATLAVLTQDQLMDILAEFFTTTSDSFWVIK